MIVNTAYVCSNFGHLAQPYGRYPSLHTSILLDFPSLKIEYLIQSSFISTGQLHSSRRGSGEE